MIRTIYKTEQDRTPLTLTFTILIFLTINVVFFYTFLALSFWEFVAPLPLWLSIVMILLLVVDGVYYVWRVRKVNVRVVGDILAVLGTVVFLGGFGLAWGFGFAGLLIAVRLFDAEYYVEMFFDITKLSPNLSKLYITMKIAYWILLFGHISGCLFYSIQMYLLNRQYFGPINLNMDNYYQGSLLAYTPILMFQDMTRYLYAIYYSFALVSTIAFGDIIGKNWIQDIYVGILIIATTVIISLVIQTMYKVYRARKVAFLEVLNQVRFLSQRLKSSQNVSSQLRNEIINYAVYAKWSQINQEPSTVNISSELKHKLLLQSPVNGPNLPLLFSNYLLQNFKSLRISHSSNIIDNTSTSKICCFLIIKGNFKIKFKVPSDNQKGYRYVGGYITQQKGQNYGVQELLVNTKCINPGLCVQAVGQALLLVLSCEKFSKAMKILKQNRECNLLPIQYYQIAKDQIINGKQKYMCSYCKSYNHKITTCPFSHFAATIPQPQKLQNKRQHYFRTSKLPHHRIRSKPYKQDFISNNQPEPTLYEQRINKIKNQFNSLMKEVKQEKLGRQIWEDFTGDVEKYYEWSIYYSKEGSTKGMYYQQGTLPNVI